MAETIIIEGRECVRKDIVYAVTETGESCVRELSGVLSDSLIVPTLTDLTIRVSSEMVRLLQEEVGEYNREIDTFIAYLPREWKMPIIARKEEDAVLGMLFFLTEDLYADVKRIKKLCRFRTIALAYEHVLRFSYFCYHVSCEARRKNKGWRH